LSSILTENPGVTCKTVLLCCVALILTNLVVTWERLKVFKTFEKAL